jgi:hypothetical protein
VLGQGARRIRDAIDLLFNQRISLLRLRHAHHPGVQGRQTCARQLAWRAMVVFHPGDPRRSFGPTECTNMRSATVFAQAIRMIILLGD